MVFFLEVLGTIAFSISGAMVAIEKKMDILGVTMLGLVVAVGGGICRDLILGNTPPVTFREPIYPIIAIITAIVTFVPAVRSIFMRNHKVYDALLFAMDTVGLGIFTVVGVRNALTFTGADINLYTAIFVGVTTGVGGGVIRDMFANSIPSIFRENFYASASIIGALVCVSAWYTIGQTAAIILGTVAVIVLRIMAVKFNWQLPRAE